MTTLCGPQLCRRLRRILHAARTDWSANEGSGDGQGGGGVTVGALVHFLVEHTKPKIFSALSPASQELWLSALRVLPAADSTRPSVTHEGYLWKRGKSLRWWQRRFYIVRYSSIFYYKNEKVQKISLSDEPRGIIDLSAVSVIKALGPSDPPYFSKHCMGLLGAGRNFFFRCDSQGDLDKWMSTLQECIDAVEEIHRAVALGSLTLAVPQSSGRRRQHHRRGRSVSSDVSAEGSPIDDSSGGRGGDANGRRSPTYAGMTPQAVALLIRADPSLKHVAAALQGLEEGGEGWRREFQEAGGWGALERLLLTQGSAGGADSSAMVRSGLECMQVALTQDALSPSLLPPDRASLARAVATCVRAHDEGVRGLALEVLAAVAADGQHGSDGDGGVVSALEVGAPGAGEGGRRGRGYAGFAVELVEALRNESAWSLKAKHLQLVHAMVTAPTNLAARYKLRQQFSRAGLADVLAALRDGAALDVDADVTDFQNSPIQ